MEAKASTMVRVTRPRNKPDLTTFRGRLAARLVKLREDAGLDVEAASKAITKAGYKIGVQALYKWEQGNRRIDPDSLPSIAAVYRVSIRSILPPK